VIPSKYPALFPQINELDSPGFLNQAEEISNHTPTVFAPPRPASLLLARMMSDQGWILKMIKRSHFGLFDRDKLVGGDEGTSQHRRLPATDYYSDSHQACQRRKAGFPTDALRGAAFRCASRVKMGLSSHQLTNWIPHRLTWVAFDRITRFSARGLLLANDQRPTANANQPTTSFSPAT
jgi:hypothetical protein